MACTCVLSKNKGFGKMVEELLAHGVSAYRIEKIAKQKGRAIKEETVRKHLMQCLDGIRPESDPVGVAEVAIAAPNSRMAKTQNITKADRDLAQLVQEKAVEGLLDGSLRVTVKDGLAASALIDKREARKEDQKFMLGLARLLSGAGHAGPMEAIEGQAIDVTPVNPMLAPESLRADD